MQDLKLETTVSKKAAKALTQRTAELNFKLGVNNGYHEGDVFHNRATEETGKLGKDQLLWRRRFIPLS